MTTSNPLPGMRLAEPALFLAALAYAALGWLVLPLMPGGKSPLGYLVRHGLKEATTNHAQIERWWRAEPNANIGLLTGVQFDVLDIDSVSALEALEAARSLGEGEIEGPMVATRRGSHLYMSSTGLGSTVNLGGIRGVDWRGEGGYVVAPPSVNVKGGKWDWIENRGPDAPIMPAPDWLLKLFDRQADSSAYPVGTALSGRRTRYGIAALERELGRLVMSSEGDAERSTEPFGIRAGSARRDAEARRRGSWERSTQRCTPHRTRRR